MIHKTEGIVLRTLKHQDANLITTLYTESFGICSFILKGYRSTRSRKKHSYFQPLSIVEVVFQASPNRSLQKVSESRLANHLQEVQIQPIKLSLGLAMVEIFGQVVKEEEANPALYRFLKATILRLDEAENRLIQIFLFYLVHLTGFLGFLPNDESEGAAQVQFAPLTGTIKAARTSQDRVAYLLRTFLTSELIPLPDQRSCQAIVFSNEEKREFIKTLFVYYDHHIEGFTYPQTMKVFAEVFGG